MLKKLTATLIFGFTLSFSYAQNIEKPRLDDYFKALDSNNRFMGSVAIAQNGKLLYTKAIGYSDIKTGTKPDENTKYRIGSITKTFTSVLIFKAIEEKKLSLEQTINQYFPTIKNSHKITIALLLSHRSGIHNLTSGEDYTQWSIIKRTEKELIDRITKGGSNFEPDSAASYSNSNFVLLSFILQNIYKKEYSKILEEKIIHPLGLKNTFFGGKIDLKNNESNSYTFAGNWKKETETDMSVPLGAGAIVSTPADLTIFAEALFGGKLVSAKSLAQMETIKDGHGMGLAKFPFDDKTGFGHTGGIDGFSSVYIYYPSDKIAVALTSNGSNYSNNKIVTTMLNSIYNKPFEIPVFTPFEISDKDSEQYPGVYSNKEIPFKITITKNNKTLMIQASGQNAYPLEATEKDKFTAEQIGVVLEFNLLKKQVIATRLGSTYIFNKE